MDTCSLNKIQQTCSIKSINSCRQVAICNLCSSPVYEECIAVEDANRTSYIRIPNYVTLSTETESCNVVDVYEEDIDETNNFNSIHTTKTSVVSAKPVTNASITNQIRQTQQSTLLQQQEVNSISTTPTQNAQFPVIEASQPIVMQELNENVGNYLRNESILNKIEKNEQSSLPQSEILVMTEQEHVAPIEPSKKKFKFEDGKDINKEESLHLDKPETSFNQQQIIDNPTSVINENGDSIGFVARQSFKTNVPQDFRTSNISQQNYSDSNMSTQNLSLHPQNQNVHPKQVLYNPSITFTSIKSPVGLEISEPSIIIEGLNYQNHNPGSSQAVNLFNTSQQPQSAEIRTVPINNNQVLRNNHVPNQHNIATCTPSIQICRNRQQPESIGEPVIKVCKLVTNKNVCPSQHTKHEMKRKSFQSQSELDSVEEYPELE